MAFYPFEDGVTTSSFFSALASFALLPFLIGISLAIQFYRHESLISDP